MSRIEHTFHRLAQQGRQALIPYVTAGYPQAGITPTLMHALVSAGADIIELGVPFSDPSADGPTIQQSSEQALLAGIGLPQVLNHVRQFRSTNNHTPVVLMGYANPLERYDQLRRPGAFAEAAAAAGVDGVLVVDYPPEVSGALATQLRRHGMDLIFLIAPTSTEQRIRQIAECASGYVYCVSVNGVTGTRTLDMAQVQDTLARIRRHVRLPVGVGFGIRDAQTARAVAHTADAVVIGSWLIEALPGKPVTDTLAAASSLIRDVRRQMDLPAPTAPLQPIPSSRPQDPVNMYYQQSVTLDDFDAELAEAVRNEERRQENHVELIASENYASPLVMSIQNTVLTNKYAEGYPGKRYYSGCEYVDVAERLAIERARALFDCDYVNVQPHAGAQANAAVFLALVSPGDTVMGMNLAQGGHLTHGNPSNFSGRHYRIVPYGLDPATGLIDYDEMERIALETRPKMLIGGFSAYSRYKDWARMRAIADKVGALFWVDMAHVAGLVAAGEYPNPLPHAHVVTSTTHKTLRGPRGGLILSRGQDEDFYKKLNSAVFPGVQGGPLMHLIAAKAIAFKEALAPEFKTYQKQVVTNARAMAALLQKRGYKIVSGGTDNHMMLIDLSDKPYTGKDADAALSNAYITANKNSVPNDPRSPFVTSGLRIGTPAVTTRGFGVEECEQLAGWLCDVLDALETGNSDQVARQVREQVTALCRRHPVYQ